MLKIHIAHLFERLIIKEFRKALRTDLPISVYEEGNDVVVVVGNRVYVNIDPPEFFFVSDVDAVRF